MTVLILCAVLALVALGSFIWLAYHNIGSDKILKPTIQITAALIAAVAFFSLELLASADTAKGETNYLAIYHNNGSPFPIDSLLTSIDSDNGQGFNKLGWVSRINKVETDKEGSAIKDINEIALDDLEATILGWLSERQSIHWDTNNYWFRGIGSGSGYISQSNNAEKNTEVITMGAFVKMISSRFSNTLDLNTHFPVGTVLSIERRNHTSSIQLESPEYKLVITMSNTGSGIIGPTRLGQQLARAIHNTSDWKTIRCNIKINATFKRTRKWSTRTEHIKKWVNNLIIDIERDFGWNSIRPDLENALTTLQWSEKYVTPDSVTKM